MENKKRYIRLTDIDLLSRPNCKIKNPERVEQLLNCIINGGPKELQIVTDFDFTLTKQNREDGKPVLSSFGMFAKLKSIPESFSIESNELYKKYRPIEICPRISQEEKKTHMIEWWRLSADLLRGFSLNPKDIEDLAPEYSSHSLRDGTKEMLELTHELNIPVLVFSAGLGDTIIATMNHEKVLHPNVKVVSNFLKYKNDMVDGFNDTQPLIHTFNKNETVLEGTEYYDMVHNRQHVILMGDSLSDAGMAEGVPKTSSIIKIGFLYHHPEEYLPKYLERFDIVLVDDQTMDIPRKILSLVVEYDDE